MANPLLQSLPLAWKGREVSGLPVWFRERQQRAFDAAVHGHWPDRSSEAWKYTSLHALAQRSPSLPPSSLQAPISFDEPGLCFVDGVLAQANCHRLPEGVELTRLASALAADDDRLRFAMGRESEDGDVFDHIHTAFASEGAWLRVADGAVSDDWLHLDMRAGATERDTAWHLSHRIEVGEGAHLRLCCDLPASDGATFATLSQRVKVRRGGRLDLIWMRAPSAAATSIARTRIHLDVDAQLRMQVLDGGGAPSRHDLRIALCGERARSELGGVFWLDQRRHADLHLDLRHESPHATSQTNWRAIAAGHARAVFDGHITVAAGADGTDAQLACKSLLESAQAEIDTKPVLEIYADDVKCSHGATVGQLDAQALFYLRSRGLPEVQARSLLRSAFCLEALASDEEGPAHRRLRQWLEAASE